MPYVVARSGVGSLTQPHLNTEHGFICGKGDESCFPQRICSRVDRDFNAPHLRILQQLILSQMPDYFCRWLETSSSPTNTSILE